MTATFGPQVPMKNEWFFHASKYGWKIPEKEGCGFPWQHLRISQSIPCCIWVMLDGMGWKPEIHEAFLRKDFPSPRAPNMLRWKKIRECFEQKLKANWTNTVDGCQNCCSSSTKQLKCFETISRLLALQRHNAKMKIKTASLVKQWWLFPTANQESARPAPVHIYPLIFEFPIYLELPVKPNYQVTRLDPWLYEIYRELEDEGNISNQVIQSVTFSSPNFGGYQQPFKKGHLTTLPETNISPEMSVLKMIFLFQRWGYVSVPWRVSQKGHPKPLPNCHFQWDQMRMKKVAQSHDS